LDRRTSRSSIAWTLRIFSGRDKCVKFIVSHSRKVARLTDFVAVHHGPSIRAIQRLLHHVALILGLADFLAVVTVARRCCDAFAAFFTSR
jgi:hypothetical protein